MKNEFNDKLIIFGCGGHGKNVINIIKNLNYNIKIIDKNAQYNEKIFDFKVIKKYYKQENDKLFFAIGNNYLRSKLFKKYADSNIINIIAENSLISSNSILGRGCLISNFSYVGPYTKIGDNNILNTGSIIEHDVEIGSNVHVGPNAIVAGKCNIKNFVFIGAGAVIKENIKIVNNVTIGAGAVVVKDINQSGVYIGCPAVKIK